MKHTRNTLVHLTHVNVVVWRWMRWDSSSPCEALSVPYRGPYDVACSRLKAFKGALLQAFKTKRSQSVAVAELLGLVNTDPPPAQGEGFQEGEMEQLLGRMQDDNQVMVSEGVVFLI